MLQLLISGLVANLGHRISTCLVTVVTTTSPLVGVGGNLGGFSALAASYYRLGNEFVFEPVRDHYRMLVQNFTRKGVQGRCVCKQKAVRPGHSGNKTSYRPVKLYQQYRDSTVKPAAKMCTKETIPSVGVSTEFRAWHVGIPNQKFAIKLDVEGCELDLCKYIFRHWPSGVELRVVLEYSLDIHDCTRKYKDFIDWLRPRVQNFVFKGCL